MVDFHICFIWNVSDSLASDVISVTIIDCIKDGCVLGF